jgi:hypothetical protein
MEKILEALKAKTEEEALAKIKLMSVPPMAITVLATADGGLHVTTSGPISPGNAQTILIEAARMVMENSKK